MQEAKSSDTGDGGVPGLHGDLNIRGEELVLAPQTQSL